MSTASPQSKFGLFASTQRAIFAEAIKLKHTLALWMCLIAPAVVVLLQTLQLLLSSRVPAEMRNPETAWSMFASSTLALWTILMLPLFVTLQSALLGALEHQDRQWKHLLTLPVPRSAHYLAKWIALHGMVILSFVILVLLMIPLLGQLLRLRPELAISGLPDFYFILRKAVPIFFCSVLMIGIQHFLAIRFRSFTVVVAIGMSATVMGFLIGQSETFGPWFPWTMALSPLTKNPHFGNVIIVSAIGAFLVLAMGLWQFSRREFVD